MELKTHHQSRVHQQLCSATSVLETATARRCRQHVIQTAQTTIERKQGPNDRMFGSPAGADDAHG